MENLGSMGTIGVVVGVALAVIALILICWKKAPQDKAIIVTGLKKRIIRGGGGLVIPFFEQTHTISLENMTINVDTNGSLDSNGVPINTDGVSVIKIKTDADEYILQAMEQFNTGRQDTTIEKIIKQAKDVLEGKLREIISKMTVEDIYKNRESFGNQVEEVAAPDLLKLGLEIKTFTIKNITDDNGYLDALGAAKIAEVKKSAAIAEANAKRDRDIKTAESNRAGEEAKIQAETQIAEAKKEKELKVQEYRAEQERAKAKADAAYEIQKNKAEQEVIETETANTLLQEKKATEIATQNALRKEQEYVASVQKQADANLYKAQKEADAKKYSLEKQAEAEKEQKILSAQAEAERIKLEAEAEADAILRKGQANAEAMKAEAEAMKEKAEAYQQYGDAAKLEMFIQILPDMARAIAEPLTNVDKITVIDSGAGNGSGVSKITNGVVQVMSQVPEVLKDLTGQDIVGSLMGRLNNTEDEKGSVKVEDLAELAKGMGIDGDTISKLLSKDGAKDNQ